MKSLLYFSVPCVSVSVRGKAWKTHKRVLCVAEIQDEANANSEGTWDLICKNQMQIFPILTFG